MIFINTRPQDRRQPLTFALEQKKAHVLELPLLDLTPVAISPQEVEYQQAFVGINFVGINAETTPYNALVVVSPTAARLGLSKCPQGFKPSCPVIAVGDATAKVLREVGWQVSCPDEASNEGMIQMPALSTLGRGHKVLVWRGRGGRRLLVNHLQDNDVIVHAIAWYQRHCPDDASELFKTLEDDLNKLAKTHYLLSAPIVLISSGEAFTNWRLLLSESSRYELNDFKYLTFGHRLTATLENLQLRCHRIDSLHPDEVWQGIEQIQTQ